MLCSNCHELLGLHNPARNDEVCVGDVYAIGMRPSSILEIELVCDHCGAKNIRYLAKECPCTENETCVGHQCPLFVKSRESPDMGMNGMKRKTIGYCGNGVWVY